MRTPATLTEQHLYFLFNPYTGLVKIGISNDVDERRRTLQHAGGVVLEVLSVCEGGARLERDLHLAFGEQRQLGEWFIPNDELLRVATGAEHPGECVRRNRTRIEQQEASLSTAKEEKARVAKEAAAVERADVLKEKVDAAPRVLEAAAERLEQVRKLQRARNSAFIGVREV